MKLACPSCGFTGGLEAYSSEADARTVAALCAALPAHLGPLVLRYLALFRPAKRALAWSRARKLLEELSPLIKSGTLRKRGRDWVVPVEAWATAIEQMLNMTDKLQLPLTNHNYLFEVLVGVANRAEAAQEAEREQDRRAARGRQPDSDHTCQAKPLARALPTDEEMMQRARRRLGG